jgi:hypothetical protein
MTDDLAAKVLAWLQRGGYPLEYETARAFRAAGFPSEQGRNYQDPVEAVSREADVVATLAITASPGFDILVVAECKSLNTNPWVVLTTTSRPRQWVPIAEPIRLLRRLVGPPGTYAECLALPERYGFSVVEAELGDTEPAKGSKHDRAHDAMQQVVSAAVGIAQQQSSWKRATFVLPVLVTAAPLFILASDEPASEQVEPVDWVRVHWHGAQAYPEPTIVDVVTRSALASHALDLRFDLQRLAEQYPAPRPT